jgi:hypothetical protein
MNTDEHGLKRKFVSPSALGEDTRRRPNRAGLPSSLQLRRDRSVFAATSPRQDAAASKDKGEKKEDEKLRRWEGGTLMRQLIVMDQVTYGMDSIFIKANGTRINTDKHG